MAPRPLRILCFGDSLTAGYTQSGLFYQPYHEALGRRLKDAFPGLEVDLDEDGENGGFTARYRSRLAAAYQQSIKPYDWVIVLGGTNDLAINCQPDAIFENLERAWSLAKLKKGKVLALTVPEVAVSPKVSVWSDMVARRDRLNSLIMGYTAPNFHALDFNAAFSYLAMSDIDRERYWDDRVHFTAAGYDLMGEKIGDALIDILKREDNSAAGRQPTTLSTIRPRKKRRIFKDDDVEFDEEKGVAEDLRRGYVVVRRKDLD